MAHRSPFKFFDRCDLVWRKGDVLSSSVLGSLIRINDTREKKRKKGKKVQAFNYSTRYRALYPGYIEINYGQIGRYLYGRRYVDKVSLSRATILFFAVRVLDNSG